MKGNRLLPARIETFVRGYWTSRLLLSAVELDLFTHASGGATPEEIAGRAGTDPASTARLLRALAGQGLMVLEDGRFRPGEEAAEFLAAGGASDSRATVLHMANLWERWSTLTECVKRGERVVGPQRSADPAWTRAFIGSMHRRARLSAGELAAALDEAGLLAGARRCLDLAGGSGAFSHGLLERAPALEATLFDLPDVVALAREYAAEAGLAERMGFIAGDLHEGGFGEGHDLVLLSAVCHMLSPADNRALLVRVRECMAPGGLVVVSDFLLDDDRCEPAWASLFGINMLVATGGGDSYTESDYRAWLEEAGFGAVERVGLPGPADLVVGKLA